MKIVVGLGNPGSRYEGTRHNIGFEVVDYLAAAPGTDRWRGKHQSQVATANAPVGEGTEQVLLVKPETFMNLSGRAVREILDFYKLGPTDVMVVCDDIALPLGKLRVKAGGSHGGQNGLRNIQDLLGTADFARLRFGVGHPGEHLATTDYVLGRFKPSERPVVDETVALAAKSILLWLRSGIEVCMNQTNGGPVAEKPKKPRPPKPQTEGLGGKSDGKATEGSVPGVSVPGLSMPVVSVPEASPVKPTNPDAKASHE
jgi:peptidyl-tRNA hydrolase, PTH1 family